MKKAREDMEFTEKLVTEWDLNELYESYDCDSFKKDFEDMQNDAARSARLARETLADDIGAAEKIKRFIAAENKMSVYSKIGEYASLRLHADAADERALKIIDRYETLASDFTEAGALFEKYVASLGDLDDVIAGCVELKDYAFYLREIKKRGEYMLSEAEEIALAKLHNTGAGAWGQLQSHLTSTLLVDIELDGGQAQKPLTVIRNMAYEADAALREKAYKAELAAYEKIDKSVAFALNAIKGEAITEAKLRGYESVLHMTLLDARMDKRILDALISAIENYLPDMRVFYVKKAELLGKNAGLPFYDLFAPLGSKDDDMRFTYEQAAAFVVNNFTKFSKKLGDFAENAFRSRWIDALPRENKSGGAFCAGLHAVKQSRVLANFDGSFNDVTTLAHELGHGYHDFMLKDEAFVNYNYSMPIAETASTFCETIVYNAALASASENEKMVILNNMISDELQVIVDIYSRFTFESEVIEKRADGSLSVGEFKDIMLAAQRKAYGDGLDANFPHPYMWLCKSHYYDSHYNFYNFPYAYGLLFAKGLYSQYLRDGGAFAPKYDALLAATGRKSLADIALLAEIDVTKKEFWVQSLEFVKKDIEAFCGM